MKIAIIGSRTYADLNAVAQFVLALSEDSEVVSGGARGVDQQAVRSAQQRGLKNKVFLPDWSLGRHAGFLRNQEIVNYADEVVAFWDGASRGTAHTIELTRQQLKPLRIITPQGENKENFPK